DLAQVCVSQGPLRRRLPHGQDQKAAKQLTPFFRTPRLHRHGTTTEEPVMNPVNLKVTLLSAAISTLILAACSSQSPEPEADRVRQQRAVSLVPAPRQDSDPVLPDRPASEAVRVEARVDEVA